MADDFALKEKELIKQNQQLELKTKEILHKVEDAMKFQENLLKSDIRLDAKFFSHLPNEILTTKDLKLPSCVDQMGTKGMLQFYKAKIKTTQDDLEKVRNELKHKSEELNKIHQSYQTTCEEKEKWFLKFNIEKNNNAKLEKQILANSSKLQVKETENLSLKKEMEQLKNILKNTTNDLNATESRLQRAIQEVEKTKTLLKNVRQEEKETKESYKRSVKDLTSTVSQIQKHKTELINGYKKQIQLIDILKKQKAHLEYSKAVEICETDFMKLLDWKTE